MARRRSRRRKSSYRNEGESSGLPPHLVLEDLSPRARRLVESGLIDVNMIEGSGEGGRITSGDILHAARVVEVEQSVARIETTGAIAADDEPVTEVGQSFPGDSEAQVSAGTPEPDANPELVSDPAEVASDEADEERPEITDAGTTSGTKVGGDPVSVAPSPWDAYNGVSEGLAESALPGAEQSWGEAEANIEAMALEAAAQSGGDVPAPADAALPPIVDSVPPADGAVVAASEPEAIVPDSVPPEEGAPEVDAMAPADEPAADAAETTWSPADVEAEPIEQEPVAAAAQPQRDSQQGRVMMDFGTLELVDPESVWAEGAEDFAPWFLAHSRQLGDVLGLDAGLSEARQFTTKSATGVVGRDDTGDDVVVVSSQSATAEDSDLGRALGMAASSGAATVALVSAKFLDEQLQALAWLNNQTKSGVQWYGIEMKVVRIADSPAAMLFELVASPPASEG
ncbi:MAG: E3 binding domain-containing protein [Acidimicrobiia bacterium]|nr:E3 binding domain-containing protein [Acidimicrobiia bacterium]